MTLLAMMLCCSGPKDGVASDGSPDGDGDGWSVDEDCDDSNADVHPAADESCNDVDDDCDGVVDDGVGESAWWPDADGDGWGATSGSVVACSAPSGFVSVSGDCDDSDPMVHPEAADAPGDGIDSDCDGEYTCESLTTLAGDLELYGGSATSAAVEFCASYNAVGGSVTVYQTGFLDLSELSCLCDVGAGLDIELNDGLTSVDGLSQLRRVGTGVYVGDNPLLASIAGLGTLQEAPYGISLTNLPLVTDLSPLRALRYSPSLYLDRIGVTSLDGLANVSDLADIWVIDCQSVVTLDGLPQVAALTTLQVTGNDSLEDVLALQGLATVGDGGVSVSGASLLSYEGLDALVAVDGDLTISASAGRTSLAGLGGLEAVGGTAYLNVSGLATLDGFGPIAAVGGDLWIHGDPALIDLDALSSLLTVAGTLHVGDIGSTNGLDSLVDVGGLVVAATTSLRDLDGLSSVVTVDGDLEISGNTALDSLSGLYSVTMVGGDFRVVDNLSISDEDAWDLVNEIGAENIGGAIQIEGNAP